MAGFVWGANGQKLTPDQVARMRIAAELMQKEGGSTTPVASPFAGLNRILQGYLSGRDNKRSDAAEAEGLASADAAIAALLGGQGGGGGGYTASSSGPPPSAAPASIPDPNAPAVVADDAMAALGQPPVHDHATHAGESHADWLKYSNQNAKRNDPLDPALVSAMSFLPELGVTMDVISGGQEAAGEGGTRTGSTRHDHGKSADADFYKDGRKLDWNNPADLPILTEIVQKAKANGVTGIGAGDDYMGAGRFHVGFGAPAVWGAGGSSANAPAWLVEAYNGAPAGTAPVTASTSGGTPYTPASTGGTDIASLLALQANPWVTEKYGGVVDALMGQQFDRQNALWEQEQRMADPMYQAQLEMAQLELDRAQQPAPLDPFAGTKEIGGVLYGPDGQGGFVPLITPPADPAAAPETQVFYDEATGQEYRAQWDGQKWVRIGGTKAPSGPLVENNIGGADGKFEEAFAKGDAATIGTVYDAGLAAQRNLGRIDQLDDLLQSTPTGFGAALTQKAGEWGIATEGLDQIQAAQAIINSLVPDQRQPGSGSMSDADLALFKQSLPQIMTQPGGNKIIIDTMRGIAQYDAEGARIVQRMRLSPDDPNYLDRGQAFDALQNRKNPLADLGKGGGVGGVAETVSDDVPEGVDPADWQFMTPEEKALFK